VKRLAPATLAVLVAGCLGAAAAGAAPSLLAPLPVIVSANGVTVAAPAQAYCVEAVPEPGDENDEAECGDVSAPTRPPRPPLPLRAGDPLTLRFQDNPRIEDDVASVTAVLGRVDDNGFHPRSRTAASRVPGTPDQWSVRLAPLPRDDTLEVAVGFTSFLVGVRKRRPVR